MEDDRDFWDNHEDLQFIARAGLAYGFKNRTNNESRSFYLFICDEAIPTSTIVSFFTELRFAGFGVFYRYTDNHLVFIIRSRKRFSKDLYQGELIKKNEAAELDFLISELRKMISVDEIMIDKI